MEKSISKKLTLQQKLAIDELFVNGFDRTKAYIVAYPKSKPSSALPAFNQLLKKDYIREYYNAKYEDFKEGLALEKYQILQSLKKQIDLFDSMIMLSLKDNLTESEELKLSRLKDIVKGSDIMKVRDMICKILV